MPRANDNSRVTRTLKTVVTAVALSAVCLSADVLAQGCAMCGTAVGDARDPLARSVASSIYFMLSMPFALFLSVGGWLAYRMRRGGHRREWTQGARPEENSR